MWDFPVAFLAEFFSNHGMLGFRDRPALADGRRRLAALRRALTATFDIASAYRHRSNASTATPNPSRSAPAAAASETFDTVIFACHADQALAALADPTTAEREILGAFPYQQNEAVLHTDARLLPRRRAARQAWNFHLFAQPRPQTTVTYYMNHLQRLNCAGGATAYH